MFCSILGCGILVYLNQAAVATILRQVAVQFEDPMTNLVIVNVITIVLLFNLSVLVYVGTRKGDVESLLAEPEKIDLLRKIQNDLATISESLSSVRERQQQLDKTYSSVLSETKDLSAHVEHSIKSVDMTTKRIRTVEDTLNKIQDDLRGVGDLARDASNQESKLVSLNESLRSTSALLERYDREIQTMNQNSHIARESYEGFMRGTQAIIARLSQADSKLSDTNMSIAHAVSKIDESANLAQKRQEEQRATFEWVRSTLAKIGETQERVNIRASEIDTHIASLDQDLQKLHADTARDTDRLHKELEQSVATTQQRIDVSIEEHFNKLATKETAYLQKQIADLKDEIGNLLAHVSAKYMESIQEMKQNEFDRIEELERQLHPFEKERTHLEKGVKSKWEKISTKAEREFGSDLSAVENTFFYELYIYTQSILNSTVGERPVVRFQALTFANFAIDLMWDALNNISKKSKLKR